MNELLDIGWRTSLVLCLLLIIARILGRRTLAQLTFFDFAVGIIIGNIAVLILSDRSMEIVLILASLVIVTFWVLVISFVSRKSLPARKILESQPILVIYKGRILEENLKRRYYNVNDLLELLREQEVFSPSHVEAALIETDGALSVLKKTEKQNESSYASQTNKLPFSNMLGKELIIDGEIIFENLKIAGLSYEELINKLALRGIAKPQEIMLCMLSPEGELYIDMRKDLLIKDNNDDF